MRRLSFLLLLCACHRAPEITSHEPGAPEIQGLSRTGDGAYLPGSTETFRAVYSVDNTENPKPSVRWTASAGQLVTSGDEVQWTLPNADEATLTLSLELTTRIATSTFRFRLAGSSALTSAAAAGVVDQNDNTGMNCDLSFNAAGNPVISYRNSTHPSLWYAVWNGSAWQSEMVDGMGYEVGGAIDAFHSMVLAADGTPHIAYTFSNNSQVWYATKSGGVWTRERVDTAAVPRYSTNDAYVGIALDPAHSNRPTVAYQTFVTNVGYSIAMSSRSGTWSTPTVLSLAGTGSSSATFNGGLAISPAGMVYFSATSYNTLVGAWPGTGTATTWIAQTASNGINHQPVSVVLDGSARPLAMYTSAITHVKPGTSLTDATQTSNPYESSASAVAYDLAFANGKPYLGYNAHNNQLEFVTTDANGYWVYTEAGSIENASYSRIGVAVDSSGTPHACFSRGNKLTYQ